MALRFAHDAPVPLRGAGVFVCVAVGARVTAADVSRETFVLNGRLGTRSVAFGVLPARRGCAGFASCVALAARAAHPRIRLARAPWPPSFRRLLGWRKSIEFGSPRRCCGFVGRPPPVSLLFAGVSSFAAARRVSSGRSISSEFDAFSPSGEPPCVCKLLGRSSDGACDPWGETFLGRSCARRAVGTSARKGRACMPPS